MNNEHMTGKVVEVQNPFRPGVRGYRGIVRDVQGKYAVLSGRRMLYPVDRLTILPSDADMDNSAFLAAEAAFAR